MSINAPPVLDHPVLTALDAVIDAVTPTTSNDPDDTNASRSGNSHSRSGPMAGTA